MNTMASFSKLLRFKSKSGETYYGEAKSAKSIDPQSIVGTSLPTYVGQFPWSEDFGLSGEYQEVAEVSE